MRCGIGPKQLCPFFKQRVATKCGLLHLGFHGCCSVHEVLFISILELYQTGVWGAMVLLGSEDTYCTHGGMNGCMDAWV